MKLGLKLFPIVSRPLSHDEFSSSVQYLGAISFWRLLLLSHQFLAYLWPSLVNCQSHHSGNMQRLP